ncbi:MAG: tetratricopeptide repeat protein [Candidatus Eremiobacteraeota bacterium]|nr:tetratricopeptide repeat protein [Candidatus Eremiobacteraeota bacterium]
MISAIFDDHYESFCTWREAGLKGLTCVHVDAHLDVMSVGFNKESLEGISRSVSREELERYRGNPRLPWGGFHCGNYLFPALKDGTVKELIWVLPAHIIGGETFVDGVRQEVQNWLDLELAEYGGLVSEDGAVVGTLEGCRFVVCTADRLPKLSPDAKVALDIDVDYFIRNTDDTVWQTPHQLHQLLGPLNPVAVTVAYSVDGGYTPLRERYLGKVTLDVFADEPQAWQAETDRLLELDSRRDEKGWEAFLEEAPDWLKAPLLLRLGRTEEAVSVDPEYTPRFQNVVARKLVKKEHQAGLDLMQELEEETAESLYLRTYLSLGDNDPVEAKRSLTKLLEEHELRSLERSRVLILKANASLELGEGRVALKLVDEALKIEPDSAEVHFLRANCLKQTGVLKKAAKAMRKALKLAEGRVSSLQMMLDAARLYDQLGQQALASSVRRELKEADVTGRYAIKTILDASKL